ncbi:MAG: DUF6427 family protein [Bacteroidales bacterium]
MFLLRIFKDARGTGGAALMLLSVLLFLPSFLHPEVHPETTGMPLYSLMFGWLHDHPFFNQLFCLLHVWVLLYVLIQINGRHQLTEFRTFMPGTFFLLMAAALPMEQIVTPELTGMVFVAISFVVLLEQNESKRSLSRVFSASLILAAGSLFYLPLFWFIPLVWISLVTLAPVTWREIAVPLVAYACLAIFLISWYWGVQDAPDQLRSILQTNMTRPEKAGPYHLSIYLYYAYLFFLVILASFHMIQRFQSRKTFIQNIYQVFFYMFVAGLLFFWLLARFQPQGLLLLAMPSSILLPHYFHRRKNHWSHELMLWVLAGLLVFAQLRT